jgi:hypothetical protein
MYRDTIFLVAQVHRRMSTGELDLMARGHGATCRSFGARQMGFQEFIKGNRIVMCLVVRAVKQGYRSFPLGLDNWPPAIRICLEFREILATELTPLGWIMAKPPSQFRAGSDILEPSINLHFILPNSSHQERCFLRGSFPRCKGLIDTRGAKLIHVQTYGRWSTSGRQCRARPLKLPSPRADGETAPVLGWHHNQVSFLALCNPFDDCCRIANLDSFSMADTGEMGAHEFL